MAAIPRSSLFDPTAEPVLENSVGWINGVVLGEIAVGLCILSVAFLGILMLTGRLPLRSGLRVVVGCFMLLGAPAIAAGFMWGGDAMIERSAAAPVNPTEPDPVEVRGELPPTDYDPYAGASFRVD
ncbi:MAG: TrbC/VirB2 family protein [Erythrobacter sp.]